MLNIQTIDHVGIRVHQKERALSFYTLLGFEVVAQGAFEQGHPIIMRHPSGVVINLLGPANAGGERNILMDHEDKHAGYTHMALRVDSLEDARALFAAHDIAITGSFSYKDLRAIFVRDPDHNVIELDEYPGEHPETRQDGHPA